ncbi:MAG: hypothetical protein ACI8S6_003273 [Myxococcota bacterium]|jgi:hypothetical protein
MPKDTPSMLKRGTLMSGAALLSSQEPHPPPEDNGPPLPAALPSGRKLSVSLTADGEALEVYAPDGTLEVRIDLTDSGPVVRLTGARLELTATETVAVQAKNFEVNATEAIKMKCVEDLHVASEKDVFVQGAVIWLN